MKRTPMLHIAAFRLQYLYTHIKIFVKLEATRTLEIYSASFSVVITAARYFIRVDDTPDGWV